MSERGMRWFLVWGWRFFHILPIVDPSVLAEPIKKVPLGPGGGRDSPGPSKTSSSTWEDVWEVVPV